MFTRTIGRIGVTAVLALGLLAATAPPTSASATGVVAEASSVIDLPTEPFLFDFDQHYEEHPTTNLCAPNSTSLPTIPIAFDSSGSGTIGAANMPWVDLVSPNDNLFKARLVIVSGTATLSSTDAIITMVARFEYRTCDSLTNLCTTNNATFTLSGPSIGHHPTSSTRVTLSGNSTHITAPFTCNSILRAALNSDTAVLSWNLHFT